MALPPEADVSVRESLPSRPMRRLAIAAVAVALALSIAPLPGPTHAAAGSLRAGVGIRRPHPAGRHARCSPIPPEKRRPEASNAFMNQASFDTNFYAKTFVSSHGVHTRVRARAARPRERQRPSSRSSPSTSAACPYELHQAVVAVASAAPASTAITSSISVTHSHGSVGPIWPTTHSGYAHPRRRRLRPAGVRPRRRRHRRCDPPRRTHALAPATGRHRAGRRADATNNRNPARTSATATSPTRSREDDKPHSLATTMTVVRADTADGRPLGLWTAFAIHGTAFGDEMLHFTGDNQAFAERIVENEIRRRAGLSADALVVHALANGTEGDISPRGSPALMGEVPLALPPESSEGVEATVYVTGDFADAEIGRRPGRARPRSSAWEQAGQNMRDDVALDAALHAVFDGGAIGERRAGRCHDRARLRRRGVRPTACRCRSTSRDRAEDPGRCGPPGVLAPAVRTAADVARRRPRRRRVAVRDDQADGRAHHARGRGRRRAELARPRWRSPAWPTATSPTWRRRRSTTPTTTRAASRCYGRQQGPHVQNGLGGAGQRARVTGAPAPAGLPELPSTAIVIPDLPAAASRSPIRRMVVTQPATCRFGQTPVRVAGGDPAVDDPHVSVERPLVDGSWQWSPPTTAFEDLVTFRHPNRFTGNEWEYVWEPDVCAAVGLHRIVVRGASSAGPYEITSSEFEVGSAPAPVPTPVGVDGSTVWFRAVYPEPAGDTPLRLRPRLATGGGGTLDVASQRLAAALGGRDAALRGDRRAERRGGRRGCPGHGCGRARELRRRVRQRRCGLPGDRRRDRSGTPSGDRARRPARGRWRVTGVARRRCAYG